MGIIRSGDLDRRITFQAKGAATGGFMGAGQREWAPVATVWAQVIEMLPSRGERLVGELNIAQRPSRIRIRYRTDVTADMRILYGSRTMEIMAPPVELGRREGLEIMAQDFSSAGNAA